MSDIIVETVEGKLRGTTRKNFDDAEFLCFLGVPYAKPAFGELRFKAPRPLEPWEGIRDATKEGTQFFQKDLLIGKVSGTEDGLHLNVFTKRINPKDTKLRPVMVWIHGGGFIEGRNNTDLYGPEYLMTEDIVLVSINYRIGFLGIFQLEDPSLEVFGNAALKDQVEALKWTQRNIKNFGGDPNNVTVFGESAGGTAVGYLVVSPLAKGLFHKGIMQSGTPLNNFAYGKPFVRDVMAFIGKDNLSEKEFLEYLRSLPIEELYEIQDKYIQSLGKSFVEIIGPYKEIPNPTAFITKPPLEYFTSGDYMKVPILISYCSNECLIFDSGFSKTNQEMHVKFLSFTPEYAMSELFEEEESSELCKKYGKKLRELYTKSDGEYDQILFLTDYMFLTGILNSVKQFSNSSDKPVYLCRMSLESEFNFVKYFAKAKGKGAGHLDDIGYLFKTAIPLKKGTPEEGYIRNFVKLWTNFAKYNNPTPKESEFGLIWKPVEKDTMHFLDIDKTLRVGVNPESNRMNVWREIYQAKPNLPTFL